MNTESLLRSISDHFESVTVESPGLMRAEKHHGERKISVLYFDCNQGPVSPAFRLSEYLRAHIADDYYQHEGSLQWNYYLYFIVDDQQLRGLRKDGRAGAIENDRTFARKYVRGWPSIEGELQTPIVEQMLPGNAPKDLAASWTAKLASAGLAAVAEGDVPYDQIIRDYLAGKIEPNSSREPSRFAQFAGASHSDDSGSHIANLRLEKFRAYPIQREFSFGTANLIRGVNGSGKTSLLEAIELCICGGIRRQGGDKPRDATLSFRYRGDASDRKAPLADAAAYRSLDLEWYGGAYRKGNRLCDNFGRFNFFDSDAGFRLSYGRSAEEMNGAIRALFLGERASAMAKTIQACRDRFQSESRTLSTSIASAKSEAGRLEAAISSTTEKEDVRSALVEELTRRAKELGLKDGPQKWDLAAIGTVKVNIEALSEGLKKALSPLGWMDKVTIDSIDDERHRIDSVLEKTRQARTRKEDERRSLSRTRSQSISVARSVSDLSRLLSYHREPDGLSLLGLDDALDGYRSRLELLETAKAYAKDVELGILRGVRETLPEYIRALKADGTLLKRTLSDARRELNRLQAESSEVQSIVESLEQLGERYCKLKRGARVCPLCGAKHSVTLLHRLPSRRGAIAEESALKDANRVVAQVEQSLDRLSGRIADASQIRDAASMIIPKSKMRTLPCHEIGKMLRTVAADIEITAEAIRTIMARQKRLKAKGMTEPELAGLVRSVTQMYELPPSELGAERIESLLSEQAKRRDSLRRDIERSRKLLATLDVELGDIASEAFGDQPPEDPASELVRRRDLIRSAAAFMNSASKQVAFESSEEFAGLESRVRRFAGLVSRVHGEFRTFDEQTALEQDRRKSLARVKKEMSRLESIFSRAEGALRLLRELLDSEGGSTYLGEMLKQQNKKLVAIFRVIHSPSEFVNVHLAEDVRLEREEGGDADLNRISSGQRSALAVSIFLSMNSSIGKRAPWLIFDDPVAQVDDLNTLSYLDVLRDFVTEGGRQVFFATANSRVANLFARKFDFLGDDFRDIKLDRPST